MSLENLPSHLVLVLVIGGPLALLRPYWAFVLATFVLATVDKFTLGQSRTTVLGPYFNALDALLLIALIAMVADSVRKRQIIIPHPVMLILVILIIATMQSVHRFGFSYDTMRALRWALSFPLFFLITANMVTDESRGRLLVLSLFLGSVIASSSNMLNVESRVASYYAHGGDIYWLRNRQWSAPAIWFALVMPLATFPARRIERWLYGISGGLFLSAIVLTFARSMWVSMVVALPILLLMFRMQKSPSLLWLLKALLFLLYLVVVAIVLFALVLPGLDIVTALRQRIDTLIYEDSLLDETLDRRLAVRYELDAWRGGTLVLGSGLWYFQEEREAGVPIAYNHVGYITYLAQLGLVGLLIYGVYLPLSVLRNSRRVWLNSQGEATRFLGLLAGSAFVYLSIVFLISGSLLPHAPLPGILAGAVWALSSQQAPSGTFSERHTSDNTENDLVSLEHWFNL